MTEADESMTGRPIAHEGGAVEPVAYGDPQAFVNFAERGHLGGVHGREWMWAKPGAGLVALYAQSAIDTLRAQLEAAEAKSAGYIDQHLRDSRELRRLCGERDEMKARAEAAEADAQRWRTWRALDEHAASDIAWAYDAIGRDTAIDAAIARTKEAAP